jgi:hypothetical protein
VRLAMISTIGLLAWLATQFLGLGLAGAGHGWGAPLLASVPLILLYPLALAAMFGRGRSRKTALALVACAAALDLALAGFTFIEEGPYFLRMAQFAPAAVGGWLVLWSGWQMLALIALIGKRGAGAAIAPG